MQSRSQKSSPGRKSVAAALWGLVDAFEVEILVLLIASHVWYTISSLVGASCSHAQELKLSCQSVTLPLPLGSGQRHGTMH